MERERRRKEGEAARRGRRRAAGAPDWIERIWSALVRPQGVGGMLCVAGLLVMGVPWLEMPQRMSKQWWDLPVENAGLLQIAVLLIAAALPLSLGLVIAYFRIEKADEERADVSLVADHAHRVTGAGLTSWAPLAGLVAMGVGAVGLTGLWLSLGAHVPPIQAPMSVGKRTEFVTGQVSGKPVRVMLPQRVEVQNIRLDPADPGVDVALYRAAEREASTQSLKPGESIEVDGTRLTFVGVTEDATTLRAVIGSSAPNTIESLATTGNSFKVAIDGESYTLSRVELDYLGALGPAAKIEGEESGTFWVFLRKPNPEIGPALAHELELRGLQTLPAAVFTVAPSLSFEPLFGFSLIFVLGMGLFFFFPGTVARGSRGLSSLNEAGGLAQGFSISRQQIHHHEEE